MDLGRLESPRAAISPRWPGPEWMGRDDIGLPFWVWSG
jgi:hypothetical protein